MANKKTKPSVGQEIIASLQEFAQALESGEDITKRFTCRFVEANVPHTRYTPALVKEARRLLGTSQAVFAQFLGVSAKTVRAWEQGVNAPSDMAARFLDEIRHDPRYWTKRLAETLIAKAR